MDKKLEGMFEKQAPFIRCKKGCAFCCKEGEYPLSELEYIDLMFRYNELDETMKDKVTANINNLLESSRVKMYACPFLVDNLCSVYKSRGLICRTFGLLSYKEDGKTKCRFV